MSLSPPTNPPLHEQIGQDNATDLMSAPSELLRQNPSGLGRQEQPIGRAQRLHAALVANGLTGLPPKATG